LIDLGRRSVKKIEIKSVKKFLLSWAWLGFRAEEVPFDPCEFGNFRSQYQFL